MDAQIKNQGSNELAERIKNSQAEPQHRFELQDPFMDTTYRLPTAQAAVAQAEKLSASAFQAVDANNRYSQIRKAEGEWKNEDGKSLADIQAGIDKESLRAIEIRAELRAAAAQGVRAETDKEMATADAHAFRRIQALAEQESAAVKMADTARENPEYKSALDKAIPGYPGTAEKVYALDAANTDKVMAKEGRKAVEFESMRDERAKRASSRPSERAEKAAAHDAENYRAETNAIEPEQRTKQVASSGAPQVSTNKVESDEIYTATQPDQKNIVPPEVEKKYLRVGDKYYNEKVPSLVAFEDKGNKLVTKSNSENIAESMVRIAEARGWDEIKVSGSETFRKEAWAEAAARGMQVKGYIPTEQDKAQLAKRIGPARAEEMDKSNKPFRARETDADNKNQRRAESFANETPAEAVKKYPELAGTVAAVAAMDAKARADNLDPAQRAIVAARVRQNVVNSIERGDIPAIKIKEEVETTRSKENQKEYSR